MSVSIVLVHESAAGERRVALSPETAKKLTALGARIVIERGAGLPAHFRDDSYAGAELVEDGDAALARLREDDLVQSRRGSGTFVQRKPQLALARFAPLQSIADVQRCFEFRIGLEEKAAALAAERHGPAQLAGIDDALGGMARAIERAEVGHDADFAFHLAVAEASGNRYFPDVLAMLRSHIDFGMQLARTLSMHPSTERM